MAEYIEREAVKRLAYRPRMFDEIAVVSVDSIDRIPDADVVEVVHGRWVKGENWSVTCSVCGSLAIAHDGKNYCPNCGAKMDGDEDG